MRILNESPWTYRLGLPFFHLAALAGVFTVHPQVKTLLVALALYSLRGIGITVAYHRLFTHESFRTSRPVAFLLAFLGGMAGQGTMSWWVSRHRAHHRYTDKPGDPHSPRVGGFFHAHVGWLFLRFTAEERAAEAKLRQEWPRELQVLDYFMPSLFLLQGVVLYAIGGWEWLAWTYFIPTVVSLHLTFLVNSLCHVLGDRPFATQDDSRNNLFFAALMFGEGWHNNHHAWPKNARLGLRTFQLDIGFIVIRSLEMLGLVRDVVSKSENEIRTSVRRYSRSDAGENQLQLEA